MFTKHMIKVVAISLLLLPSLGSAAKKMTPEDFGIELQNKVTAEVLVVVRPLQDGKVEYEYTLRNSTMSQQALEGFFVQVDVNVTKVDMLPAPGWDVGGCCISNGRKRVVDWLPGSAFPLIRPGDALGGFRLRLKSLPAVKDFHAQGFTTKDLAPAEGLTDEDYQRLGELQSTFANSFSAKTLGPDPVPEVVDPSSLIDRLISLKRQAASLGWITGEKFIRKLDKRLEKAKRALSRNKPFVARAKLKQFIRDLEHQRRKQQKREEHEDEHGERNEKSEGLHGHKLKAFLNDNAFFLLQVNAEFTLSKLPEKPKDKDEDKEAKEEEKEEDED